MMSFSFAEMPTMVLPNTSSIISSTPSVPQGKFLQRLWKLELENEKLKKELGQLKRWKSSVEIWLEQQFAFVSDPEVGIQREDNEGEGSIRDDLSMSSRQSRDTDIIDLTGMEDVESTPNTEVNEPKPEECVVLPVQIQCNQALQNHVTQIASSTNEEFCEENPDGTHVSVGINPVTESKERKRKCKESAESNSKLAANSRVVETELSELHSSGRKSSPSFLARNGESEKSNNQPLCNVIWNADNALPSVVVLESNDAVVRCNGCASAKPELGNKLISCTKCQIWIHQGCIGVSVIPESGWICRPCTADIPVDKQTCIFCPKTGGALIPVSDCIAVSQHHDYREATRWAHICCTFWIPGPYINDPMRMDFVKGVAQIEKDRWKLQCSICKKGRRKTCCVQCIVPKCSKSFHVTCAFRSGLRMDLIEAERNGEVVSTVLCIAHKTKSPYTVVSELHLRSKRICKRLK